MNLYFITILVKPNLNRTELKIALGIVDKHSLNIHSFLYAYIPGNKNAGASFLCLIPNGRKVVVNELLEGLRYLN